MNLLLLFIYNKVRNNEICTFFFCIVLGRNNDWKWIFSLNSIYYFFETPTIVKASRLLYAVHAFMVCGITNGIKEKVNCAYYDGFFREYFISVINKFLLSYLCLVELCELNWAFAFSLCRWAIFVFMEEIFISFIVYESWALFLSHFRSH